MQNNLAFFSIDSEENNVLSPVCNYDNTELTNKLEKLTPNQKSIEEASQLFIEISLMKNRFNENLELWIETIYKNPRNILAYFYLANHIIQESKRKGLNYYTYFFNEIKKVLTKLHFPNINISNYEKIEILRTFEVLIQRCIFDENTPLVEEYLQYLQSKMPKEVLENFNKEGEYENVEESTKKAGLNGMNGSGNTSSYNNVNNLNTKLRYLFKNFEDVKFRKEIPTEIDILRKDQKKIGNLLLYIKERVTGDEEVIDKYLNLIKEIDNIKEMIEPLKKI